MLEPGDYVENTIYPEWGVGTVDYLMGGYIYVDFKGTDKKFNENKNPLKKCPPGKISEVSVKTKPESSGKTYSRKQLGVINACRELIKAFKKKNLASQKVLGQNLYLRLDEFPELAKSKDVKSAKNIIGRLIRAGYLKLPRRQSYSGGAPGLGKRK